MKEIRFPDGYRIETLVRQHARRDFRCGESQVDDWLQTKALQHQSKRLSVTKVLLDPTNAIAGFYTLATGQVDFGELPLEISRKLPKRALPVAMLAWMGIATQWQGRGLGERLLAWALRDAYEAGQTFAFVAVVLDCITDAARRFYQQWDFAELPGQPNRLYLSSERLVQLMHA